MPLQIRNGLHLGGPFADERQPYSSCCWATYSVGFRHFAEDVHSDSATKTDRLIGVLPPPATNYQIVAILTQSLQCVCRKRAWKKSETDENFSKWGLADVTTRRSPDAYSLQPRASQVKELILSSYPFVLYGGCKNENTTGNLGSRFHDGSSCPFRCRNHRCSDDHTCRIGHGAYAMGHRPKFHNFSSSFVDHRSTSATPLLGRSGRSGSPAHLTGGGHFAAISCIVQS
jgi:hypothetical protein